MPGEARILLIRHGETELNAKRVLQPPETPLSARGVAQAERLAGRIEDAGLLRLLASDLRRAEMTAEAIAARTRLPLERDPDLAERNFGHLRGRPYASLDADPFAPDYEPPGGESWDAFHARVDRAWSRLDALARATPGPIAVVTHGLFCRSVVTRRATLAAGLTLDGLRWQNTSLTILEPEPTGWHVTLLDDASHLEDDEPTDGGAA
jgi:broad specificity phosphatase PhoE